MNTCQVDVRESKNYMEKDSETGKTRYYDFKVVKKLKEEKFFHPEYDYMFQLETTALVLTANGVQAVAVILEDDDAYGYALI